MMAGNCAAPDDATVSKLSEMKCVRNARYRLYCGGFWQRFQIHICNMPHQETKK